jgi:hypothetical protein
MEEKVMEEKPSRRTGVQYLAHNKEDGGWVMSP